MENMTLVINGETRSIPVVSNVLELLRHLKVGAEGVAVELNKNIIRRRDWKETPLSNGDRVEIVQLVGGG